MNCSRRAFLSAAVSLRFGLVANDDSKSELEGGAGEDWFFKYPKDSLLAVDPLLDQISQ